MTYEKKILGLISIQSIITVFIFSVIAYYYLDETFFTFGIGTGESMCINLLQCFFTVLNLGPRSTGSIGDVLLRPSYEASNRSQFFFRYIYDLTIFYIITIVDLKVLFGVIIMTFARKINSTERPESDGRL